MKVKYVLFVRGGGEDGEALELLERVLGDELVVIDVRESSAGGWMLWEYGSDETPLLATPTGVYYGVEAIKSFVEGFKPRDPPRVVRAVKPRVIAIRRVERKQKPRVIRIRGREVEERPPPSWPEYEAVYSTPPDKGEILKYYE